MQTSARTSAAAVPVAPAKRRRGFPSAVMAATVGLLAFLAGFPAVGQEMWLPPDLKSPLRMLTEKEAGIALRRTTDEAWTVYVAYEGYLPRTAPQLDAAPAIGERTAFMQDYGVLFQGFQKDQREWLLLGEVKGGKPRVVGWIPQDYVVPENNALYDSGTKILKKAMLVNRVKTAVEGDKAVRELPMRESPSVQGKPRNAFELFNIFFIYRHSPGADGDAEKGWALLGAGPGFEQAGEESGGAKVVLGWVPVDRLCVWNTRVAIEWDRSRTLPDADPRRTTPAKLYRSRADAYNDYYPGFVAARAPAAANANVEAFFHEEFREGSSVPFEPHWTRFPELDHVDASDEDRKEAKTFPNDASEDGESNRLLRLGGIGGGISLTASDDMRKKLDAIVAQTRKLELLFVVDDTGSMKEYFDDVAKVVEAITSRAVERQAGGEVRVAVSFFNDVDGNPPGWNPVKTAKLTSVTAAEEGGRAIAAAVRAHKKSKIDGGLPREMVFHGLTTSIQAAGFSDDSSRKLVVLIGDVADKSDENDPDHTAEAAVVANLRPDEPSPIEFFAVHVGPRTSGDQKAFKTQAETIVRLLETEAGQKGLGAYVQVEDGGLSTTLERRWRKFEQDAAELREQLKGVQMGQRRAGLGAAAVKLLEAEGVDLRRTEGIQIFQEVYAWENPRDDSEHPQVRRMLLFSAAELEELLEAVKPFTKLRMDGDLNSNALRTAFTKVVDGVVGDDSADDPLERGRSFAEAKRKSLGIPNRVESCFLQLAKGNFHEEMTQIQIEEVKYRHQLLRDVLDGKRRTWTKLETKLRSGRRFVVYKAGVDAEDYDRKFPVPGSNDRYYWIDAETELP